MPIRDSFFSRKDTSSVMENPYYMLPCFSFCHTGCGLSKYAEQCGEAIHAKFKPTWQRYKCNIDHKDYGDRLKTAVVDFGIKRL